MTRDHYHYFLREFKFEFYTISGSPKPLKPRQATRRIIYKFIHANVLFLCLLKKPENQRYFNILIAYKNDIGQKWIKVNLKGIRTTPKFFQCWSPCNDVNVHKSGKMSFNTNELVLEQGHVYSQNKSLKCHRLSFIDSLFPLINLFQFSFPILTPAPWKCFHREQKGNIGLKWLDVRLGNSYRGRLLD